MKTVCGANLDHASNERLLRLALTKGALSGLLVVGGSEEAAGSELPGRLTCCRLAMVVK
jgi:hypothetical protein